MPDQLKSGIESLSGIDMSDVRVHPNSARPAQLGALAYAQGNDIHLGPGQERHLAHEAWHVAQQRRGRVRETTQMAGVAVNDDDSLEREADDMGARAGLEGAGMGPSSGPPATAPGVPQGRPVAQTMVGFELELAVLVDIDGRPVPEKRFLGRYGAQNLELQVDHNGDVEGPTPRPAVEANFWNARALNPPGVMPLVDPGQMQQLGAYDLEPAWGETRVAADGSEPAVDGRDALPHTMLKPANWEERTRRNRFTRPPGMSDIGMNNAQLPYLDIWIPEYDTESRNWEPARAVAKLTQIIAAATAWLGANNNPPSPWHPQRRARYARARAKIRILLNEANAHLAFWAAPGNAAPPAGISRQYRRAPTAAVPNRAWRDRHPIAGQGGARYASILEIVTAPYQVETPDGRAGLIAAMTEATQLAAAIENATNNFTNRAQFNAIPNTNIANPLTHVGNDHQPSQSTEASIQSTFAIDLSQIPSLMKSTVFFMAPQTQFGLKHQADQMAGVNNLQTIYRAQLEMSIAVSDATHVIEQVKAQIIAAGVVPPPSFVNLRGLVTLVCQYLRLGRYWQPDGVQVLDKNLTDLLSRTDLAQIYRDAVTPAEKTWLVESPVNRNFLVMQILARTNREGASMLLNNPHEDEQGNGGAPFTLTCSAFADRVFDEADDGITPHLGGFQRRPVEDIDPLHARPDADVINPSVAHPNRMAPVFEMRNMMPKLEELHGARFSSDAWVPLATYMATTISLLNARTAAQAVQDQPVLEHTGGPAGPTGLGPAQAPW